MPQLTSNNAHKLNGANDYSSIRLPNSTKILSNNQQQSNSSYMNSKSIVKTPLPQQKKMTHNNQISFKKANNSKENKYENHLPDI